MTVQIDTTAENNAVRLVTQGTHPSAPSSGHVLIYHVTGTASPGVFMENSAGDKIGPFVTGTASSGSGDFATIFSATMDYIAANNSDPIDTKLTQGDYISLIYLSSQNAVAWKSATNATHTVSGGKTLVPLFIQGAKPVREDPNNRRIKLYNSTDAADAVIYQAFQYNGIDWEGDLATASKIPTVASGKTVVLQIWNGDTNKRAMGGWIICKEI